MQGIGLTSPTFSQIYVTFLLQIPLYNAPLPRDGIVTCKIRNIFTTDPEGPDPKICSGHLSVWNQFQGGPCDPGGMIRACQVLIHLLGGRGESGLSPHFLVHSAACPQLIEVGASGSGCLGHEKGRVSFIPPPPPTCTCR